MGLDNAKGAAEKEYEEWDEKLCQVHLSHFDPCNCIQQALALSQP